MRNDYRVISRKRLPAKAPITETIVAMIAVEVFMIQAPWTYVISMVFAIWWFTYFCFRLIERIIDPFDITL